MQDTIRNARDGEWKATRAFSAPYSIGKITWKLIKEIINKIKSRSELPYNFLKKDNSISDPLEIANYFNEYFVNIGSNLAKKIPESLVNFKSYLDERNCNSIFLDAILESEVANQIDQSKVTKSGGYDELAPKVMRNFKIRS